MAGTESFGTGIASIPLIMHSDAHKQWLLRSGFTKMLVGTGLFFVPVMLAVQMALLFPDSGGNGLLAALVLRILGVGYFGLGLADWAQSKGQSAWYGLLALLPVVGLFWVTFLKDLTVEEVPTAKRYVW